MKNCTTLFLLNFLLFLFNANAQSLVQQYLPVEIGTDSLEAGFSGGLNIPQFSSGDFNNDGIDDLFVFDKEGDVLLTFENGGTPNQVDYTLNPELKANFPDMKHWAMLRDYNQDGIPDIFTYSLSFIPGVSVFRGSYGTNNIIEFTKVTDYIEFTSVFNSIPINLLISKDDFPAIDDIDNDGDLDIVTFGDIGGWISYFENQSVQMGYGSDSLIFHWVDECWGRVFESGLTNTLELSPRIDSCPHRDSTFLGQLNPHVGSNLLTLDMDNDQDKELFLGDLNFSDVLYAKNNAGNPDTAWFVDQENMFPSYDFPIDIDQSPAMFSFDVNNDGLKDFMASPGIESISVDIEVAWYYKNVTNNQFPVFNFVQKDFVVGEMIDIGDDANPTFFDHNNDGLLDIVLGGYGRKNTTGNHDASLFLYENIGTTSSPKFKLIDNDYGGLFVLGETGYHPSFGDYDGDGDQDMVVGDSDLGELKYLENMDNGSGIASFPTITNNWQGIDMNQRSTPFAFDLNKDGLLDLIVGQRNGYIHYYENQGTTGAPNLVQANSSLGFMDARSPSMGFPIGFGAVAITEESGNLYVYLGTEEGVIRKYFVDPDSLYAGSFPMLDGDFGMIREGERTKVAIADINSDGAADYLIGNKRGGVSIYSSQTIGDPTTSNQQISASNIEFLIWPNPTNEVLNLTINGIDNESFTFKIYNALGQSLRAVNNIETQQINISKLAAGVYFAELSSNGLRVGIQKFIKQ